MDQNPETPAPDGTQRPTPEPGHRSAETARTAVILVLSLAMVVLAFGLGWGVHAVAFDEPATGSPAAAESGGAPDFAVLQDIYEILQRDFVDPSRVDPELLREGAINGMLEVLNDPHSVYISPEALQAGAGDLEGSFEGIGATVDQGADGSIVIIAPFSGSPAERAGIRAGDIILRVDGESTEGWTVQDAVRRIRGPRGTQVTLTVEHQDGRVEDLTITRDEIVLDSLRGCPDDGGTTLPEVDCPLVDRNGRPVQGIAYVQIVQFTANTPQELHRFLQGLDRNRYRGLIVDLRNNPGGLLGSTVDVADEFLDGGNILIEVDRDGNERVFQADSGGAGTDLPLVVLVNHGSASGAEVVAGALRDHGRAVIIGETTFGKGTVNQLRELSDGGGLYVSVSRWLTPNRKTIEGTGITPDIQVAGPTPGQDPFVNEQLYAAIDYLRARQ